MKIRYVKMCVFGLLVYIPNIVTAGEEKSQQVSRAETAFAQTMADRDLDKFQSFIADEAVFFAGNKPLKGKEQVVAAWRAYFQSQEAPFSWKSVLVEVLPSGSLALSSGPVFNSKNECIGTFNSVWRLDGDNWKVVFDRGSSDCSFISSTQ